jgi:two-component system LytT family response regulator
MHEMNAPISVVIADDEELARRLIREFLGKHSDMQIVAECENGLQAVQALSDLQPALIFLDIHMPKLSGLEVLALSGRRSGVIFSTAYDAYALKAFELHALDYLLKPYTQQRFDDALTQARKLLRHTDVAQQAALTQLVTQEKIQRIVLRERGQIHMIALSSIDYIAAEDDYIRIFAEGREYLKTQSLSELEAQLDARQFVRIHRSYLLRVTAMHSIVRLSKDSLAVRLQNGQQLPLSRSGYQRLHQLD